MVFLTHPLCSPGEPPPGVAATDCDPCRPVRRAGRPSPVGQGSDEALEGYIAECEGWPAGYQPSDEELRAIASLAGAVEEDEGEP